MGGLFGSMLQYLRSKNQNELYEVLTKLEEGNFLSFNLIHSQTQKAFRYYDMLAHLTIFIGIFICKEHYYDFEVVNVSISIAPILPTNH